MQAGRLIPGEEIANQTPHSELCGALAESLMALVVLHSDPVMSLWGPSKYHSVSL